MPLHCKTAIVRSCKGAGAGWKRGRSGGGAGGRHDGCYVLVTVATRMRRQMAKQNQMTHRGIADAALYLAGLALHGVNVRQALAPLYRCERALTKGERAEARRWWDAFVCVSPALNPRTRRLLDTELAALVATPTARPRAR